MNEQQSSASPTRVFLSYARGDDEPFVNRLQADLKEAGFTVWFDRDALMSRGLSFHQEIKDAIRTDVDRIVYVGGPQAALSAYVREEWQFALECDNVVVTPILRLGDYVNVPGELSLMHCEDFREDSKYDAAFAKLTASLRLPNPKFGALFAVPNLPPNFLGRPELMRRVRDALLVDLQKPRVITGADAHVGMQGMGGIGKSVLAAALARNRQAREAYPDGVAWIACGQNLTDDDLLRRQRDLVRHLDGDDTFASLVQGQSVLRQLLAAKAVLLVLDDVWRAADAQAFDVLGPRCRMLVTTRDKGILDTLHGELVPVSLFTEPEALQLLADAINVAVPDLPAEAREVARECGFLPLALALCGGMAGKRGGDFHSVLERLRRADLEKIADRESINEQHRSIWRAMQASVDVLTDLERKRFAELAVFDTDNAVPESAVATLWAHTGVLGDLDTEELLINLFERSLIQLDKNVDGDGRTTVCFSLHDLLHDFVVRIAGEPCAVHQNLIDAYRKKCLDGWHSGPHDGYYFGHICQHIAEADGNWDEVVVLLCDLRFVEIRCRIGDVFELIAEYRRARENLPEAFEDLQSERARESELQRWATGIVDYARKWSELRDRHADGEPMNEPEPNLPNPIQTRRTWAADGMRADRELVARAPTRLERLEAFAGFVSGQCYPLAEHGGRPGFVLQQAFNAAPDGTVHDSAAVLLSGVLEPILRRRWPVDAERNLNAALLLILEGHNAPINCVRIAADGRRAVSSSADGTLRHWDMESGACLHVLEGHLSAVGPVDVTPDGRYAFSIGFDRTLRVWDLDRGTGVQTLEITVDGGPICVTPDGRMAVVADGRGVQVLDLHSGLCRLTLEGHVGRVACLSVTPDGRCAVTGSSDGTLRVWDLGSGISLRTLGGHRGGVRGVWVTPDGRRVVSGSADHTLRVWDLGNGVCQHTLRGHSADVMCVAGTPDGQLAVSGSADTSIIVWDLEAGTCLHTLSCYDCISDICISADGRRAVSAGSDHAIRMWDLGSGRVGHAYAGHSAPVLGVHATPDGTRALSVDSDRHSCQWALDCEPNLQIIEKVTLGAVRGASEGCFIEMEYTSRNPTVTSDYVSVSRLSINMPVFATSMTQDGRQALAGYADGSLRVWDLRSAHCLHTLSGHDQSQIQCVSVTPDGRHAVSGSGNGTIQVWDLEAAVCTRVLAAAAPGSVTCLSVTPDGRYAITGGLRDALRVWDIEAGTCMLTLAGDGMWVTGVSVAADGKSAISASWDGTTRIWDIVNGACLHTLGGHHRGVQCVAVLAVGAYAVSASWDNTVRLWDMGRGQCIAIYVAPARVTAVTRIGNTAAFLAGSVDGDVFTLDVLGVASNVSTSPDEIETAVDSECDITTSLHPRTGAGDDAVYEARLRGGLEQCRRKLGDHPDTAGHLGALACHLEGSGKTNAAAACEHERAAMQARLNPLRETRVLSALRISVFVFAMAFGAGGWFLWKHQVWLGSILLGVGLLCIRLMYAFVVTRGRANKFFVGDCPNCRAKCAMAAWLAVACRKCKANVVLLECPACHRTNFGLPTTVAGTCPNCGTDFHVADAPQ